MSRFLRTTCKFLTSCAFVLATAAPLDAVPAGSAVKAAPAVHAAALHRPAGVVTKNPHLKGVEPRAAAVKASVKKKATGELVHGTLHRRWDYHSWITLHRGLGTIRGFVHAPNGGAMSLAKVWLKRPNGSIFASISRKHITYTDGAGNFAMFGVRPSRYRVVALVGKKRNHVITAVHPGTMSEVAIKV